MQRRIANVRVYHIDKNATAPAPGGKLPASNSWYCGPGPCSCHLRVFGRLSMALTLGAVEIAVRHLPDLSRGLSGNPELDRPSWSGQRYTDKFVVRRFVDSECANKNG